MENQIQALIEAGYEVDVFCLGQHGEPRREVVNGANVYRAATLERRRGGRLRYAAEYLSFWLATLWFLTRRQITHRYDIITVQTLPDFLIFTGGFARLLGARLILDLRECTPEIYQAAYDVGEDNLVMRLIILMEQLSIKFADYAVTCTEQMRETFVRRGANPAKIEVMLNVADPALFADPVLPDPEAQPNSHFRIVNHGTIKERYGHETLIEAMAYLVEEVPGARLEIMGAGPLRPELEAMVRELGLEGIVTFAGFVPDDELMERLRSAHCGTVPLIRTPETELIHTFKMYEYMALGLPVVISRTAAVDAYFDDSTLCFFEPGDARDLASALAQLSNDVVLRHCLANNALKWYQLYGPAQQRAIFREVVGKLVGRRLPA